jgi:hypothetical protein
VHNHTIYNLANGKSSNYVWNETEGDLCASIFASIIIHHLIKYCTDKKLPIVIFSDGCGYQNRNVILSNALLSHAVINSVIIQQKYLEKGHTQMECDSTHSLIEKQLKKRIITLPTDYVTAIQEARSDSNFIEVAYLHHDFFLNYDIKANMRYDSIRPGNKTNDPTVNNLRVLKYEPSGVISFKTNYEDDFNDLPRRPKKIVENQPKRLFSKRLEISFKKFSDLAVLKNHFTPEVQTFYNDLPHLKKGDKVKNI